MKFDVYCILDEHVFGSADAMCACLKCQHAEIV